jgi:hypothetical protein
MITALGTGLIFSSPPFHSFDDCLLPVTRPPSFLGSRSERAFGRCEGGAGAYQKAHVKINTWATTRSGSYSPPKLSVSLAFFLSEAQAEYRINPVGSDEVMKGQE